MGITIISNKRSQIRRLRWPEDTDSVNSIDASFSTDSIYRIESTALSFIVSQVIGQPPVQKSFDLPHLALEIQGSKCCAAVEIGGAICGVAAIDYEAWNRRAILRHLYVSRPCRGLGAGRQLLNTMLNDARDLNARCLWIETQNTNHPAVQFYLHCGFKFCGLDQSLYEPKQNGGDECALYFVHDFETP